MSRLLIILIFTIPRFIPNAYAANGVIYSENPKMSTAIKFRLVVKDLSELKNREIEKIIGRRLRLKEKLKLFILKMQLKKEGKQIPYEADPDKQATISMISGAAVLIVTVLGLFNVITGAVFLALVPALALLAMWLGLRSARSGKNFKNMFGIIAGGLVILTGIAIALGALIFGVF